MAQFTTAVYILPLSNSSASIHRPRNTSHIAIMSSSKPSWMRRFHVPKAHRRPPSMVFQANAGLPSFDVASASDSLGFVTLASPKNPEIDIIFVHGIDGGSFSSWAKNGDPKYYWPKEWLPNEVGLGRARIHTYGYNVNPKRSTNAHVDFARQLLCDLICSPLWFGKVKTTTSWVGP